MIAVKYFGAIAEKTNSKSEEFLFSELPLSQLLASLEEKYQLSSFTFSIAINKIIINTENCILRSNDEVALLPPFAGG